MKKTNGKTLNKWLTYHYIKLWESEFDGIVSKRDKLQDANVNQLKLEVHDTYKKDQKIKTNLILLITKMF